MRCVHMSGNMVCVTDALGNQTAYTYDERNRLVWFVGTMGTAFTFRIIITFVDL